MSSISSKNIRIFVKRKKVKRISDRQQIVLHKTDELNK